MFHKYRDRFKTFRKFCKSDEMCNYSDDENWYENGAVVSYHGVTYEVVSVDYEKAIYVLKPYGSRDCFTVAFVCEVGPINLTQYHSLTTKKEDKK